VRVPAEAGLGNAKVTLSFPAWKEGNVAAARLELPVVDEPKKAPDPRQGAGAGNGNPDRRAGADKLKQIGVAFHNYMEGYKCLPFAAVYAKDGTPLLSWRVALLPALGHYDLYKQFRLDEPWDSPHNKKFVGRMPSVLAAPGADPAKGVTFYRVFTGPGTLFDGKARRSRTIPDGNSTTILVVEAGEAVPWTKPDELPYDKGKPLPKLGGIFRDGFHILYADGHTQFVGRRLDERMFRTGILFDDGNVFDEELLELKK
jgi:hypothetical protein